MNTWRFLPYSTHSGAMNMALDEAILDSVAKGTAAPTLRLYGFKPQAVSLGYNQSLQPDQARRIKNAGFDIVRRPTGGRAVAHANELTYSFAGTTDFLSTSVITAYKQICQAMIMAFSELGITVSIGTASAGYRDLQDCFLATTGSDLHYQGLKIAGSAQLRRQNGVLQHGSILLDQEQSLMPQLLMDSVRAQETARHANLYEILGKQIPFAELGETFRRSFADCFSVNFESGRLSDAEMVSAEQGLHKYRL